MGRRIKGKRPITIIKEPSVRKAIVDDQKKEITVSASAVDKTFGDITVMETEPIRRYARVPKEVVFDHLEGGQFIITKIDRKGDDISRTAIMIQPNLDKEVEKLRELERQELKEIKRKFKTEEQIPREELRRIAKIFDIDISGADLKNVLTNRVKRGIKKVKI